jgi:hypothetical protein
VAAKSFDGIVHWPSAALCARAGPTASDDASVAARTTAERGRDIGISLTGDSLRVASESCLCYLASFGGGVRSKQLSPTPCRHE